MRILFSFFFFVLISVQSFSQNGFNKTFAPADRLARCIDTIDDGYIVMGNIAGSWCNTWLLRLDANGDTIWTKTYGTDSIQFLTYDMSACADGGFILCGDYQQVITMPSMDSYVMKVDSAGNIVWFNRYGVSTSEGGNKDYAERVVELSNGKLATAGIAKHLYTDSTGIVGTSFFQGYVCVFDSMGNEIRGRSLGLCYEHDTIFIWQHRYVITDMKTVGNRIFVVFLKSDETTSQFDGMYITCFNENLDTLFTSSLGFSNIATQIEKSNNGNLFICGDNFLTKMDTLGNILWQTFPSLIYVTDLVSLPNGNIQVLSGLSYFSQWGNAYPYSQLATSGTVLLSEISGNGILMNTDTLISVTPAWHTGALDFTPTIDNSFAFAGGFSQELWVVKLDSANVLPVDIQGNIPYSSFKVYPNPAKNLLFIEGLQGESKIQILAIDGKLIKEINSNDNFLSKRSIDVKALSPGLYILNITTENGRFESMKFVVE